MKKGILLIGALVLTFCSFGQKTMSHHDFGDIGDQVIFASDTAYIGNIYMGTEGSFQDWYFDYLQNHQFDTLDFLDPSMTQDSVYPASSNLALQNGLNVRYWYKDTNELTLNGITFGLDLTAILDTEIFIRMKYSTPIHQAKFIMEYDQQWYKIGSGSYTGYYGDTVPGLGITVDSFRLNETVTVVDSINGFGRLILPTDTFDCLRQEIDMVRSYTADVLVVDTFFGIPIAVWTPVSQFIPQPIPNQHENYIRYWARGRQYPVLEFLTDSIGDALQTRYLYNADPYVDGIREVQSNTLEVSIFPNPVTEILTIQMDPSSKGMNMLLIYNAEGKIMHSANGRDFAPQINTSEWANGIYFLRIWQGSKEKTIQFVKK